MPNIEDIQTPCPLNREPRNKAERNNPANAMVAHCFQLHDTLRILYGTAQLSDKSAWKNVLATMQTHLDRAKEATILV